MDIIHSGILFIAIAVVANTSFPLLWTHIDKMRLESGLPAFRNILEIWNNVAFFLAAYTFPVQPLALILSNQLRWSEPQAVIAMGSLCLVSLTLLFWRLAKYNCYA